MYQKIFNSHLSRGAFYALTIILGMGIALEQLDLGHISAFFNISLALSAIFLIELYSSWIFRASTTSTYFDKTETWKEKIQELTIHFILPLGLFFSSAGFIFFNRQHSTRVIYLGLLFMALTVLFTNIRAFYEHKTKIEAKTHYVYDTIKLFIIFTTTDTIFNSLGRGESAIISVSLTALIIYIMLTLNGLRYKKFELKLVAIIFAASMLAWLGLILILGLSVPNPLQLASISTIFYYILSATIHHYSHHNLTRELVLEYATVVTIVVVLLFGLAR